MVPIAIAMECAKLPVPLFLSAGHTEAQEN